MAVLIALKQTKRNRGSQEANGWYRERWGESMQVPSHILVVRGRRVLRVGLTAEPGRTWSPFAE